MPKVENKTVLKKLRCCEHCGVELSYRELARFNYLCYVCNRIRNEKNGLVTEDTIEYD